jgi:PEP-CTERM motif
MALIGIRKSVTVSLLALLASIGSAPAHAAAYTGTWDPDFGGIFTDLGWKGSASFILPDTCLGLSGSFANAAASCGGGGMQVTQAKVTFYDRVSDPDGLAALQTLDFGTAPVVYGMSINSTGAGSTQLLGANTGFFAPVKGQVAVAQAGGLDYYFHLIVNGNQAALMYTRDEFAGPGCVLSIFGGADPAECGFSVSAPNITFTTAVPEPQTYALMLGGLAVLAAAARRRRQDRNAT